MTNSELIKIKISALRKKQFLDILRLRVPHGEMGIYQRMQAEVFLSNIRMIANDLRNIENYNDILTARDMVQDLNVCPDREEKQVIEFILKMLHEMMNSIVFNRKVQFQAIKESLVLMLEEEIKDIEA